MIMSDNSKKINASPTKDFFISMLTKDIDLVDAILDLIDNSIDGARNIRKSDNYTDIWVRIELDKEHFRIADNAGGISLDIARDYAFRFGRAETMTPVPHSIGQFGVGMKRAIFKIGKVFKIISKTATSSFSMNVDVDEWKKKEGDWAFEFDEINNNCHNPEDEQGTIIEIQKINPTVRDLFDSEVFISTLRQSISKAQTRNIQNGLSITLNQIPVDFKLLTLQGSEDLKPAYIRREYGENEETKVIVKMYAGLSESDPHAAGWYIFCNGRLILGPDQTITTGWGEDRGKTIPQFHNQYARFRGYAFFDSDDSKQLPWNTTKTGMDIDAKLFKAVRQDMIKMTRSIIDFLNNLKLETRNNNEVSEQEEEVDITLRKTLEKATQLNLDDIILNELFVAPAYSPPSNKKMEGRISYSKPIAEIEKVQKLLRVKTYKEVGELTFDYYLKMEGDD